MVTPTDKSLLVLFVVISSVLISHVHIHVPADVLQAFTCNYK